MNVYILIPVYNEEQVIIQVIADLQRSGYHNIIIIDDGSTDKSYQKLKKLNIILLHHSLNRGKGAAIKTGIQAAKKLKADIVITFDGDGQHDPTDIIKLINKIKNGYDVVLGSRFIISNNIPFYKRMANFISDYFIWLIYGLKVTDSQSGLRAYSKQAINLIDTQHDRYEYDSEIIREIVKNKLKYTEIPIKVNYTQYAMKKQNKQNLINGLKTFYRILKS